MLSTSDSQPIEINRAFRPTARLLQLLGDELISSPRLAVFELVKNSYDADATSSVIRLEAGHGNRSTISVFDDGEGMTLDTLQSVWLVPGNNHRQRQRTALKRTIRHNRLPIGEKGLGRFAAHKLGNEISLVTRAAGSNECVVEIDWNELTTHEFLEDALVTIVTRPPEVFVGEATGTRIRVSDLRQEWTRGEVRRLHNQVTSICSPFDGSDGFQAILQVPGHEEWTRNLPDVAEILNRAFWKFSFELRDGEYKWEYDFRGIPGINVAKRTEARSDERLGLPRLRREGESDRREIAGPSETDGIGEVSGVFYVFDRERAILNRLPDQQAITRYLDEFGGLRVYRDGIRVYNYGEQGDDWLGLDLRRVNNPTRRVSRNIVLGAIHLSLADSQELVEKTNREGFVENDAFHRLRRIVLGALSTLESERQIDKDKIRAITTTNRSYTSEGMVGLLSDLRNELQKTAPISRGVNDCLRRIERHYNEMQETLLSAGMSGLTLSVIFHEVERSVRSLHQAAVSGSEIDGIERQAALLAESLDGFSVLLRRNSQGSYSAKQLIEALIRISGIRLNYHNIAVVCPLLERNEEGFRSKFAFNLVLGALNNVVDNAIYWLRQRWADGESRQSPQRKLYIGVSRDFSLGPAIIVADNGPGLRGDSPANLVKPFFTRRPDGIGLGLYYTNLAMHLQGGQLALPAPGEVEIPSQFDGAVLALIFSEDK